MPRASPTSTDDICNSLRTSETNYLNEAFSFYSAIRARGYYSKASKEDRSDLMVKKLRYYARFIVVCLLLKKMKLVRDLVRELAKHIDDYTATYEPDDQLEWSLVLSEIKSFIEVCYKLGLLPSVCSCRACVLVFCAIFSPRF